MTWQARLPGATGHLPRAPRACFQRAAAAAGAGWVSR